MSIFALTQKEWTRGSNQVRLSDLSSKQLAAAMSNMGPWSSASDLLAIGGEYAACLRKVSTTIFLTPCTASPNMCSRKRSFYLRRLSVLKPFTGARGPRMCRGRTRPPPRQFMTLGPIVSVCVCVCVPALIMVSSPVKNSLFQMNMAGSLWKSRLERLLGVRISG